jgi:hypothetical protein
MQVREAHPEIHRRAYLTTSSPGETTLVVSRNTVQKASRRRMASPGISGLRNRVSQWDEIPERGTGNAAWRIISVSAARLSLYRGQGDF